MHSRVHLRAPNKQMNRPAVEYIKSKLDLQWAPSLSSSCSSSLITFFFSVLGEFICTHTCVQVHIHVCESQELMSNIFLNLSSHYFLSQGLSLNLEFTIYFS